MSLGAVALSRGAGGVLSGVAGGCGRVACSHSSYALGGAFELAIAHDDRHLAQAQPAAAARR